MGFQGHQARKRFGQHWLKDQTVLERIVAAAALQPSDRVLEVGPGRGALTERLLSSPAAAVHAVELDRDLVDGLRDRFADDQRFSLRQGDVLVINRNQLAKVTDGLQDAFAPLNPIIRATSIFRLLGLPVSNLIGL